MSDYKKQVIQNVFLGIVFLSSMFLFSWLALAEAPNSKSETPDQKSRREVKEYRMSPPFIPAPEEYGFPVEQYAENAVCGNKVVERGEECDDGNVRDGDGCSSTCKHENLTCGNNTVETGEECGEPTLPPCLPPKVCKLCHCVIPQAVCGNGKIEEGEQCGEPGLICPQGYKCESCKCISMGLSICGNGVAETGEQCNEPGLACGSGLICNTQTCECIPPGCGNGVKEQGEACGEQGLPECPTGLQCNQCRCVSSGCGYLDCPEDSRCHIQYCRDTSGGCVWGQVEPKNFSNVDVKLYDSGTISVPECCAQISYQAYVGFDPCTGEVNQNSYDIRITGVSPSGGSACTCPIQELDPNGNGTIYVLNGQIVGCNEAIDPSRPVSVSTIADSNSPRLRIQCSDCCGSSKNVEKSIRGAQSRPPISCNHPQDCPSR